MSESAELKLPDQSADLPVVVGTENEHAVDITKLRSGSGYITLDNGFANTGSCRSAICFIDGEKGILRYRGYPIEQLAERSSFVEVAYLLIWGELPNEQQLGDFRQKLADAAPLDPGTRAVFETLPERGHPMAALSAMINIISGDHPELLEVGPDYPFADAAAKLLSEDRVIASHIYNRLHKRPFQDPDPKLGYTENLLHMMFSGPDARHEVDEDVAKALDMILILHADHEQNCSTSTMRMVGSSKANLFTSASAAVSALWGPLHGGANVAVLAMLEEIHNSDIELKDYIAKVKDKQSKTRLMGFGHRVYKNFDPRARILKSYADKVLDKLGVDDPLLDIARQLEETALHDEYFIERKLYPNVDFYSGIVMRAMGIPTDMFTVFFALGRMPGWIAHWYEAFNDPKGRINRPRQIYVGETERDYVPIGER